MYDTEGFFDFDADIEQYQLEEAGRQHARRHKRMLALLAAGDKQGAAEMCMHGWQQRLKPGEYRCRHCGSRVDDQCEVLVPCEFEPES